MKKFLRNAAMFAFAIGMVASFSACHSGDNGGNLIQVPDQVADAVLVISTNVDVTVNYGGQTLTVNKDQVETLANPAKSGQLVATPTDAAYLPQTVDVKFAEGQTEVVLDFQFVKKPTQTLPQSTVEASTTDQSVSNTDENQEETGNVEATITVPAGTTVTEGNTTDDYSIVVYTPVSTENYGDVEKNDKVEEAALAIACTPDNAVFSQPVKVSLNVPGSEGLEVAVMNSDNDEEAKMVSREGAKLQVEIPHFSVWDLILKATCTNIKESSQVVERGTHTMSKASEYIRFKVPYGYELNGTTSGLIKKYINKVFGIEKRELNRTASISGTPGSDVNYVVSQKVRDYEFTSGSVKFNVRVYGSPSITYTSVEPITVHSGGSN